jgi:hypothetical protein
MEADAVIGVAQEGFPAGTGFQDALFVFPPQVLRDTAAPGDDPNHALGEMDVQIVGHDLPLNIGVGSVEHPFQESRKIGLAPMVANLADPKGSVAKTCPVATSNPAIKVLERSASGKGGILRADSS